MKRLVMSEANQLALKLEVLRSVEVEGLPIEMGVLKDGTPFLSGRGLAKACGISNSTLVEWGEFTPKLGDNLRAGKMAEILAAHGYENSRFFIRVPDEIYFRNAATISAYPDAVCMAFLEYYAFEAGRKEALQNFRILGRGQLRNFIYKATGYNPEQSVEYIWKPFHDRHLLNKVPAGYFSVFQETSGVTLRAIQNGLMVDSHTIPDISMGRAWSEYWKNNKLAEKCKQDRIPHPHRYPDYFPQSVANEYIKAYVYPIAALSEFRKWLDETYLPGKYHDYLQRKVKQGVLPASNVKRLLQAVSASQIVV
jgi:hypothetical protein